MPVLVNCPSCKGPLRVTDALLGRKVRCPACQTVFTADAPGDGAGDAPAPTVRFDSWKNLNLELSRDVAPPPPPPEPAAREREREREREPSRPSRGLVGAVEVDPGPQEAPRRPPPPPDDRRDEPRHD